MITFPILIIDTPSGRVEFSGTKVLSSELVQEVDPLSLELPISTLEFTAENEDPQFTIFAPDAQEKKRFPVSASERVGDSTYLLGKFFVDSWENPGERQVKFYAIDYIGLIEKITFDGIFWESEITVQSALQQTLGAENIPFSVDPTIANTTVSGWIPPGTLRQALRLICFSSGAVAVTQGRVDIFVAAATLPEKDFTSYIDNSLRADNTNPRLAPPVSMIELVSHNYTQGTTEETVFDKELPAGETKIVFEGPYFNIDVNGPGFISVVLGMEDGYYFGMEDDALLEVSGEYLRGVNSVTVNLSEPGVVTITGIPWVNSKQSFLFKEPSVPNENVIVVADATLVNAERAPAILDRLRDFYRQRFIQEMTVLPSPIRPTNIIVSGTHYGRTLIGVITRQVIDLSGGFLIDTVMRGVELILVPPMADPYRRPRTKVAICGADMTRQNMFREYA
ncbi:MAG: hypothetical protein KF698_08260 [Anaerolineales bacterium]|nr:hypothetical protein [Anaerolineales bacterium]